MEWEYTAYAWPFLIAFAVSAGLLRYAWRRRHVRSAWPLVATIALAALWSLLSGMQVLAVGLAAKVVFSNLRYVAIATLPVAWLVFALVYTGRRHWLTAARLAGLLAVPCATLVLTASNGLHGLMFEATALDASGPVPGVARVYGPWFWFHTVYSYTLMGWGVALIAAYRLYAPALYRRQATLMLVGAAIPFALNALYLANPDRFASIDLTPVAFAVSGLFFAWGLFRHHLLDLMPVARTAIVESLPDPVVVLDERHRVVDLNPSAQDLLRTSAADAIGMPIAVLTEPLGLAWPEDPVTGLTGQEVVLTVGGELRCFAAIPSPLQDRHGHAAPPLIVLVLREITALKRSELLEAGQRRVLERIADGTPLPEILNAVARFAEAASPAGMLCSILLLDEDGTHLHHGAAPSLPAGYTQAVDGIAIGPAAGTCGTAAYRAETVVTTEIAADPRWKEYRHLALPCGLRACWSTPIFSAENQVLGTFAAYYRRPGVPDPTDERVIELSTYLAGIAIERRRFEAELIRTKEAAEEMASLKSAFLANMSHEIRSPLTSIIGFADLLDEQLGEEHRDLISHITKGGRRLLDTLNSVLDYARLEAGRVEIRMDRLNVAEAAREAVAFQQPQAQSRGLHLRLDLRVPSAWAELDPTLLLRVFNNLVDNALKFTAEGGVSIVVDADAAHVYLRVRDTGIGIDESFLPFIFDEFRQESSGLSRSREGCGLGLKITQRIVEQMKGTITVESRKGEGSTFTVTFPRCPDDRPDPAAEARSRPALGRASSRQDAGAVS